jgi:hypothetical protein
MSLPPEYNSSNTYPEIFFTPPIFNPLGISGLNSLFLIYLMIFILLFDLSN